MKLCRVVAGTDFIVRVVVQMARGGVPFVSAKQSRDNLLQATHARCNNKGVSDFDSCFLLQFGVACVSCVACASCVVCVGGVWCVCGVCSSC